MATQADTNASTTDKVWFITGCSTGFGRELGMHAMEHYTELRNIYFETT